MVYAEGGLAHTRQDRSAPRASQPLEFVVQSWRWLGMVCGCE